jgi:hypothetical protein
MDPSTLILVTFPEARYLIYAQRTTRIWKAWRGTHSKKSKALAQEQDDWIWNDAADKPHLLNHVMPFDLLSDAHDEKELQTLRIQFKRMTT